MKIVDLYKNSQIHKIIAQDLLNDRLNHCYLINSIDSFLLEQFSFLVVKEILCEDSFNRPCLKCLNCQKIEHKNMVDLCIYPKDDKKLMTEDINEIVSDSYITPIENKYKIYILKNFESCTIQAQNKILKTLEEPPRNVIFILTSSNENLILPTILSRSKKINIPLLSISECKEVLDEMKYSSSEILSNMCSGNVSIAESISKTGIAGNIVDLVFDMLLNLKTSGDVIRYSSRILVLKKDINIFLDALISILRDISVCDEKYINFKIYIKTIKTLSTIYTKNAIKKIIDKVTEVYKKIELNCNLTSVVDKLLFDILEVKFLCQN